MAPNSLEYKVDGLQFIGVQSLLLLQGSQGWLGKESFGQLYLGTQSGNSEITEAFKPKTSILKSVRLLLRCNFPGQEKQISTQMAVPEGTRSSWL